MNALDLIHRAKACSDLVPKRTVSERTLMSYSKEFARMWRSHNLDPLSANIAVDTYYHRRASLHACGKRVLDHLIGQLMRAGEQQDIIAARHWAIKLKDALQLIESAFLLEPPAQQGILPWNRPPSRWHKLNNSARKRGANSKKHVLKELPKDWDVRIWETANDDWTYRDVLAIHLIVPVRPEELVPSMRPSGWSPGVIVELREPNRLAVIFVPVKSCGGLYGTGRTTVIVDPIQVGGPALYLAEKCKASGGTVVINAESTNAVRKAIAKLGRRALPNLAQTITPYLFRHQLLADLKKTFGGGEIVASAAGHCTDRTQARYASFHNGRKRRGYLSIISDRGPRSGNVLRARHLSEAGRFARQSA